MMSYKKKVIKIIVGMCFSATVFAAPDIKLGKEKSEMCFNCHGSGGNSQSIAIPSLAEQKPAYIVNQLRAFRSGLRKNGMMKNIASSLSNEEMTGIAAYLTSLKMKPAGGDVLQSKVATEKISQCKSCHGRNLQGRGLTPRLAGQQPHYLKLQLNAFKEGTRKNAMMNGVAMRLSDKDIYKMSEYIGQLK